ncbi:MAG: zinc protease [Verrucomicrobiota bacterium]|jgi:zinc protease
MTNSSRLLLILALSAATLAAEAAPLTNKSLPFPQEGSDLKPDPAAHFGTLPNGLRYVVRANQEPKGRASLRLLVLAGSLHEKDDQRGLAHFLEHMAFNGSTHYPPGTIVEFFQRIGMSFGADTNANTSFDRTVYRLDLAHADDASLVEALQVFGDYAGGLLLTEEEINKERGVILSETRASDSAGYRSFVARFESTLGTTLLPRRLPLGLPEVITKAQRERFTDFWNAWYRPEKMVVVVVGDFPDAGKVEKMVAETFAHLTARASGRSEPSLGTLAKLENVRAIFHAEPEAPATNISLITIAPYAREADSAARKIKRLPRLLALAMLNRRFSILSKKEGVPFVSGGASISEQFNFLREANVNISCKADDWVAALGLGEQELRRALEHGFTPAELTEAAANLANQLDQAAKTASTRHSNRLADELVHRLVVGEVATTPADDLALLKPALDKITPTDCQNALKDAFAASGRFVMVSGNAKISEDASATIAAAYGKAHAVAVAEMKSDEESKWGYTDFGAPGEIAKREHIADLDIDLVTFKNGARLNLKKTEFEAGRIVLSARVGTGGLTEPAAQRGLQKLAASTFSAGGLGKHSFDDVRHLLAGKNVGWRFGPGADAFRFNGRTTRDDLLLELQLLAAQLTDPGYRPEALRVAHKEFEQLYQSFKHTAAGPLELEIANLLADGDPRFGLPAQEVMMARNLEEVKAWLTPELAHGPLEVALVGDFDVEAAIAAAAKTIGALPPRQTKPALAELKKVHFPEQPFTKSYVIDSEIPKASVMIYWPTEDGLDAHRTRRVNMVGEILSDRLRVKVREEVGGSYSPRSDNLASDTFPGWGYILASIDVDPAKAEQISDVVIQLADDLAKNGVTEDELNRARLPLLTSFRESLRTNGYWLSVLASAQEKPEKLGWARDRIADNEAITVSELNALAKKYLPRERASRATILPAGKPK